MEVLEAGIVSVSVNTNVKCVGDPAWTANSFTVLTNPANGAVAMSALPTTATAGTTNVTRLHADDFAPRGAR